jgi:hypothetical protein
MMHGCVNWNNDCNWKSMWIIWGRTKPSFIVDAMDLLFFGIYKNIDLNIDCIPLTRAVWRYQRGNQNPYIKEEKTQWSKEKVPKDKQQSTKHRYKSKDRVTGTPLKTGVEQGIRGCTRHWNRIHCNANQSLQK